MELMILGNYSYVNSLCGHTHSGTTNSYWYFSPHAMRGYYGHQSGDNTSTNKLDAMPTGASTHYAYVLAPGLGLLTATTTIYQSATFDNLNLAGGLNAESSLSGSGNLTGELGALAFLISSLSGSGDLTGDIQGAVFIAATLAGSGDLTGALGALIDIVAELNQSGELNGSIAGALSASATLAGSGDLTGAIKAVVDIIATINGTGLLSAAIIGNWNMAVTLVNSGDLEGSVNALAHILSYIEGVGTIDLTSGAIPGDMATEISNFSELSPESLATAVWSKILEGNYNEGEAGKLVADMEILVRKIKALTTANL